jgi:hypothetical protein
VPDLLPNEPHLRLDFYFDGNYCKMDKFNNGNLDISIGHPVSNANGGPGGMSSDLMDEIYSAIRIFTQRRNFRVGSVVTHIKGGNNQTIKSIDYVAGTAKSESGTHIILSQTRVVER